MVNYGRLLFICAFSFSTHAFAQGVCGDLKNAFGPFDYWLNRDELQMVEKFHFNSDVESLRRGINGTTSGGDLDYTLRAFPNHSRALISMINLGIKEKTAQPRYSTYTVECWIDRAVRFRPNDATVRMVYGTYLQKVGRNAEAIKQLESAEAIGGANANMLYNMGLAYFDLKEYEKALSFGHRAYQTGYSLPGLKNKLVKVGKWRDLPPQPAIESGKEPAREAEATPEAKAEGKPEAKP